MPDATAPTVLLTGATGYLGRRLAQRFIDEDCSVLLWVHATDETQARQRAAEMNLEVDGERNGLCWGDLRDAQPFAGVDPSKIDIIVHTAAITRFNIERELAEAVNVAGSQKLFDFAETCPALSSIMVLSTVYAAGLREGRVDETVSSSADNSFANHYEWSKHTIERDLAVNHATLPWSILRVATVIADGDDGTVVQYNAFHNTLKLLFYGLLSMVPGSADTPLYFVTGDFVVEATWQLAQQRARGVYHICHQQEASLPLATLIDVAFERFQEDEDFRARAILRPLLCDAEAFGMLGTSVEGFGGPVLNQGLQSIAPFSRQLFSQKQFDNERLRHAYPAYTAPDPRALAIAVCDYLTRTRWNKRGVHAS